MPDESANDLEEWEVLQKFHDREDFPRMVAYCQRKVAQHSDDPHWMYHLGNAYVLNEQYEAALEYMARCHGQIPDHPDFHHVILDALFALGRTEDDFEWVEQPDVCRLDRSVLDSLCAYLRPKRKPRTVTELYTQVVLRHGYVAFSDEELLEALLRDPRFLVDSSSGTPLFADVRTVRRPSHQ